MEHAALQEYRAPHSCSHPGFCRPDYSGTVFGFIEKILNSHSEYRLARSGVGHLSTYLRFIENEHRNLLSEGLTENQCHLVTRMPLSEEEFVDDALERLRQSGLIHTTIYQKDEFLKFRQKVEQQYDHDRYMTFIFPEEERLIYALSYILKPANALFLGSYYGYWGIWMMPAVRARSGHAIFVDPNPHTCAVAQRNLSALGFSECSQVIEGEGTQYLHSLESTHRFDFVLLDAEGPKDAPQAQFRGKRVYLPLMAAVLPYLKEEATVVTHNILIRNHYSSEYFADLIRKNLSELQGFLSFTNRFFPRTEVIETTEGIGVYRM